MEDDPGGSKYADDAFDAIGLTALPQEVVLQVLAFCAPHPQSFASIPVVCRYLREVSADECLWVHIFASVFGPSSRALANIRRENAEKRRGWRDLARSVARSWKSCVRSSSSIGAPHGLRSRITWALVRGYLHKAAPMLDEVSRAMSCPIDPTKNPSRRRRLPDTWYAMLTPGSALWWVEAGSRMVESAFARGDADVVRFVTGRPLWNDCTGAFHPWVRLREDYPYATGHRGLIECSIRQDSTECLDIAMACRRWPDDDGECHLHADEALLAEMPVVVPHIGIGAALWAAYKCAPHTMRRLVHAYECRTASREGTNLLHMVMLSSADQEITAQTISMALDLLPDGANDDTTAYHSQGVPALTPLMLGLRRGTGAVASLVAALRSRGVDGLVSMGFRMKQTAHLPLEGIRWLHEAMEEERGLERSRTLARNKRTCRSVEKMKKKLLRELQGWTE